MKLKTLRTPINNDILTDHAVAALIALAIGDAAGDNGRDNTIRNRYGVVTGLLPEGKSTDDTEFTVLSAISYLDCSTNYTPLAVANSWRKLVIEKGGAHERAGLPLYGALWNLQQGLQPPFSGIDNVFNNDDGAAMRAVPFGIVAAGEPEEAARLAAIDACISHDGDGIRSAQAVAASIAAAISGASVDDVITAGLAFMPPDTWLGRKMLIAMDIAAEDSDIFIRYEALHTRLWTPKHSSAAEAIPQMYALYRMADGDFRKGLVLSANFGRDADTICALVLALSAAGSGLSAIPPDWIEQVRRPSGVCLPFAAEKDLVELGKELAKHGILRQQRTSIAKESSAAESPHPAESPQNAESPHRIRDERR